MENRYSIRTKLLNSFEKNYSQTALCVDGEEITYEQLLKEANLLEKA